MDGIIPNGYLFIIGRLACFMTLDSFLNVLSVLALRASTLNTFKCVYYSSLNIVDSYIDFSFPQC